MRFPETALREALHARLETSGFPVYFGDGPAEVSGVYLAHRDSNYAENGTKGHVGWDVSVMIDAWDATPGSASSDNVSAAMDAALDALTCSHDPLSSQSFLSITGYKVVRQDVGYMQNLTTPGDMPHAVLQMVFYITQA